MIKVIYNKVCGRCVQSEPLTSGMVGQPIHFEYSHDFDGLTLTAVFTNGKTTVDVLNPGNQCVIPHEVLDTVGTLVKVGIYATRGNELVIPTVYAAVDIVLKGADPSGDVSIDPTLPVWAQTQALIGNLNDLTTEAKNNLVAAINEVAQSGGGGGGSVPKPLTYDYMPEGYPSKTMGTVTVMEEQELAFVLKDYGFLGELPTTAPAIVAGKTYTVNWDGTEYECVCFDFNSYPTLGNLSIMGAGGDTGEPFIYVYNTSLHAGNFATLDRSPTHTISVKTTGEIVTPMAEEFIPTTAKLPNPNAITFTGAVTGSYDGSAPLSVEIPSGGGSDISLGLTGAAAGQIAKITAVDDTGKPTAWEAVDMPSGGSSEDMRVIKTITITADNVNSIYFNNDDNGLPFALTKHIRIRMYGAATNTGSTQAALFFRAGQTTGDKSQSQYPIKVNSNNINYIFDFVWDLYSSVNCWYGDFATARAAASTLYRYVPNESNNSSDITAREIKLAWSNASVFFQNGATIVVEGM